MSSSAEKSVVAHAGHAGVTGVAVYTAMIGQYENLLEQPLARSSDVPFICYTDDPDLSSSTWEVRQVEPHFPHDPVRSARRLKVLGHPDLDGLESTIWIDNRVVLRRDPIDLLRLLGDGDLAAMNHSFRETIRDEFAAVLDGGHDDPTRVGQQYIAYETCTTCLEEKPIWTGFMIRRASDDMRAAMSDWFDQILLYSRRDQLSVHHALHRANIELHRIIEEDIRMSDHHEWVDARDSRLARRRPMRVAATTAASGSATVAGATLEGLAQAHQLALERATAQAEHFRTRSIELERESRRHRESLNDIRASRTYRFAVLLKRLTRWPTLSWLRRR